MNNARQFEFFQKKKRRCLSYDFKGGDLSSDGGVVLLREFDEKIGFSQGISDCITDTRNPDYITHTMCDLVRERLYMILQGYEDCNDATYLRSDPTFKALLGRTGDDPDLASQPTLSRLENRIDRRDIKALITYQIETWLASYETAPDDIILDIDSTDDPTHGHQQLSMFHGYYDQYMYHPIIFGCNGHVIFSYLRPGTRHASRGVIPLLRFLLKYIRNHFPNVVIKLRADSGFASPRFFDFLEDNKVHYAIALITNKRLIKKNKSLHQQAQDAFDETGKKQRLFQAFIHDVKTWSNSRRVIAKAEVMSQGSNNRFVVTTMTHDPQSIYDDFYTQRGAAENDIKELKHACYADRLSCHQFQANFLRLVFSTCAYQLMIYFKRLLLDTPFDTASIQTIRLQLFKVAVRVHCTVRRLWFNFSTSFAHRDLFILIHQKLLALS